MSFLIWFVVALLIILILNQSFQLNDRYRFLQPGDQLPDLPVNILYPSIGCPLEVAADPGRPAIFHIYITGLPDANKGEISVRTVPVTPVETAWDPALTVISVRRISSGEVSAPGNFSGWVNETYPELTRLTLQWDKLPDPGIRRNLLFDLVISSNGREYRKESCLFVSNHNDRRTVLQATDIHVSRRWDAIDSEYRAHFTGNSGAPGEDVIFTREDFFSYDAFHHSFSNPNTNFIRFIKKANEMHRLGTLDFIVASGDLVDFKYQNQKNECSQTFGESEWDVFLKIVSGAYEGSERLEVPVYTLTGNHDYRLYPYRLQVYGLQHCAVPDDMLEAYLTATGQLTRGKYRLSDVNAIRTNDGQNHSLGYYYLLINPFDDYFFDAGGNRFIFLDTKSDAACHFSNLLTRRGFALFSDIEHPSSHGISDAQVRFLETVADTGRNITLFCHAPVLNSPSNPMESDPLPDTELMMPRMKDARPGDFERELQRADLSLSVIFHNQYAVLNTLISNPNNTVVLSGHNHRLDELGLDKASQRLYRCRYPGESRAERDFTERLFLLQTPSLGHVQRSEQERVEPSYRLMEYDRGRMVSTTVIPVAEVPFDLVNSHIVFSGEGAGRKVELFAAPQVRSSVKIDSLANWFIVACLSDGGAPPAGTPLAISPERARLIHEEMSIGFTYWVFEVPDGYLELQLPTLTGELRYQFGIKSFIRTSDGESMQRFRRFYQSM